MEKNELAIICVDDDARVLDVLADVLQGTGFQVFPELSAGSALERIAKDHHKIVMVISDLAMPEMDGLSMRRAMLDRFSDIPFLVVSGHVTREVALTAIELKISGFIQKPFEDEHLLELVDRETKKRVEELQEAALLRQTFIDEAMEILPELEDLILAFENDPQQVELLNGIFRVVHTLKGSSGAVGYQIFKEYCHHFENLISRLKSREQRISDTVVSLLLKGFDRIQMLIELLSKGIDPEDRLDWSAEAALFDRAKDDDPALSQDAASQTDPGDASDGAAEKGADAKKAPKAGTIQVPVEMLNDFMGLSGEITVIRNMVNKLVATIEQRLPRDEDVKLLGELLDEMHKINSQMQQSIVDLRKEPLSAVFRSLPRIVRDSAAFLKKRVQLNTEGGDTRVDHSIAQALKGSLVHLVRNSIDHGLELPAQRAQAGKDEKGQITVRGHEADETIVIEIQDDGAGIDVSKIRSKVVDLGWMSAEKANRASPDQLFPFLFESGFSTAAQVTDISGRGVGMDMVRSSVENLDGQVIVESEPGSGSCFRLVIPIPKSVQIIPSLIVQVGGHKLAICQDNIVRVIRIEDGSANGSIFGAGGTYHFKLAGEVLPLIDLAEALGLPKTQVYQNIVVLRARKTIFAVAVDGILDAEDTVVKGLHASVRSCPVWGGATFLGDGSIGLIVSAEGLAGFLNLEQPEKVSRMSAARSSQVPATDTHSEAAFLLFELGVPGLWTVCLEDLYRLEEVPTSEIQQVAGRSVLLYRNQQMPIWSLSSLVSERLDVEESADASSRGEMTSLLVYQVDRNRFVGLEITRILDAVNASEEGECEDSSRSTGSGAQASYATGGKDDDSGIWCTRVIQGRAVCQIDARKLMASLGFISEQDKRSEEDELEVAQANQAAAQPKLTLAEAPQGASPTDDQASSKNAALDEEVPPVASTAEQGNGWGIF